MKMVRVLTEEERIFISDMHQKQGKVGNEIIEAFKDKFNWIPAASTVTKYQLYEPEEKDEDDKKTSKNGLNVLTGDTRKQPELYDFSDGEIEDDVFEQLVKLTGKSHKQLFNDLKKALSKGYTKVDLKTGDLSK